jgi:leucyl-tRNA---protein transferase
VLFKTPASPCEYLPAEQSQFRYELVPGLRIDTYTRRLLAGWRRIGPVVFRPDCAECRKCESLRVLVRTFRLSASQRRVWKRNEGDVQVRIAEPSVEVERQTLFARFHEHGHQAKGWPAARESRLDSFLRNPFPTEEWSYRVDNTLVGVGYVDALPEGLSAIYYYHEPTEFRRSLGTFNILKIIESARQRGLPHVYLGYYVAGCRSLEYKARFRPNEKLVDGRWTPFQPQACDVSQPPDPAGQSSNETPWDSD